MPYLRMFLAEKQIDELFISEVFLQSVLGHHIVDEEKEKMLQAHASLLRNSTVKPSFTLDAVPSSVNYDKPLSAHQEKVE